MKNNLIKSTYIFSIMTFISRITGLLREMVFAYFFGASDELDIFNISYRIPNFLRSLLGEGAFSQAIIPIISEYKISNDQEKIKNFLNRVFGIMIILLLTIIITATIFAPILVRIFAPGFVSNETKFQLTISMLRITFPYIFFVSITAYISSILNAYGKFGISAFSPNLLNISLIIAAIFFSKSFAIKTQALSWAVLIGGIIQLLFHLPSLYKLNLIPTPTVSFNNDNDGIKRMTKLMIPAIFGVSISQISFLVDNLLASFLPIGSISWLNYSNRLTSFPMGIFGVAIATVILPYLSRQHALGSTKQFSATLDWALKFILITAFPAAIMIIVLSGPIIITLFKFKGGQFSNFDVLMVQRSVFAFGIGIPAFMLVKVLASSFYSCNDVKTPVKIAIISMLCNIILVLLLFSPLKHVGLSLATSFTSMLNAALLFFAIKSHHNYNPSKDWGIFLLQLFFANIILFISLKYVMLYDISIWIEWNFFTRIINLGFLCISSMLVYITCLFVCGLKWKKIFIYNDVILD